MKVESRRYRTDKGENINRNNQSIQEEVQEVQKFLTSSCMKCESCFVDKTGDNRGLYCLNASCFYPHDRNIVSKNVRHDDENSKVVDITVRTFSVLCSTMLNCADLQGICDFIEVKEEFYKEFE